MSDLVTLHAFLTHRTISLVFVLFNSFVCVSGLFAIKNVECDCIIPVMPSVGMMIQPNVLLAFIGLLFSMNYEPANSGKHQAMRTLDVLSNMHMYCDDDLLCTL